MLLQLTMRQLVCCTCATCARASAVVRATPWGESWLNFWLGKGCVKRQTIVHRATCKTGAQGLIDRSSHYVFSKYTVTHRAQQTPDPLGLPKRNWCSTPVRSKNTCLSSINLYLKLIKLLLIVEDWKPSRYLVGGSDRMLCYVGVIMITNFRAVCQT